MICLIFLFRKSPSESLLSLNDENERKDLNEKEFEEATGWEAKNPKQKQKKKNLGGGRKAKRGRQRAPDLVHEQK